MSVDSVLLYCFSELMQFHKYLLVRSPFHEWLSIRCFERTIVQEGIASGYWTTFAKSRVVCSH